MTPQEFLERYAALRSPEAIAIVGPQTFTAFPPERVEALPIASHEKAFLLAGLPTDAAPYLNFGEGRYNRLPDANEVYRSAPGGFTLIGHNNYGDPICVERATGCVVYLQHDGGFRREFMNSSLSCLAESLYLFQRAVIDGGWQACLRGIAAADPDAIQPGSFWAVEAEQAQQQ